MGITISAVPAFHLYQLIQIIMQQQKKELLLIF